MKMPAECTELQFCGSNCLTQGRTQTGGEVAGEGTRAREGGCERIVVMAVTVCANAQQTKCGGRSV